MTRMNGKERETCKEMKVLYRSEKATFKERENARKGFIKKRKEEWGITIINIIAQA